MVFNYLDLNNKTVRVLSNTGKEMVYQGVREGVSFNSMPIL